MNSFDDFVRFAQVRQTLRLPTEILDRLCLQETDIRIASGQREKSACCFSNSKGRAPSREKAADKSFIEAFKKLELHQKIHFYCESIQFLDRVSKSIYTYSIELPNQPLKFAAVVLTKYHFMDYWSPCSLELWSTPPLLSVKFHDKLLPYDLKNYLARQSRHKGKYFCVALEPITEFHQAEIVRIGFKDEQQGEKVYHLIKLIILKAQEQLLLSQMGLHFKETELYKAMPQKFEVDSEQSNSAKQSIISREVGEFLENRSQRMMSNNFPTATPTYSFSNSKTNKPLTANPEIDSQSRGIQSAKGTGESFRAKNRVDSGTSTKIHSKENSDTEQSWKTTQNSKNAYKNCPRPPLPTTPTNNMRAEMANRIEESLSGTMQSFKTAEPPVDWRSTSDLNDSESQKNGSQEKKKQKALGIWTPTCNIKPGEQFKPGYSLTTCKIQKDQDKKLGVKEVGQLLHQQLVSGHEFVAKQYQKFDPIPSCIQKEINKNHKQILRRQSTDKLLKEQYRAINGIPTHPSRVYEEDKKQISHLEEESLNYDRLNSADAKKQNKNYSNDPLKQARAQFMNDIHKVQKSRSSAQSINVKNIEKRHPFRKASPKNNRHYDLRIADLLYQGPGKKSPVYEDD